MIRTIRTPAFFLLAGLIVLSLAAFSFTYTVPFNERAVVTLFGSASDADVKTEPGLKFKLPYPFQTVTSYDTRLRLVKTTGTQQQTADDNQIIVEAYALWRVSDPLAFYRRFSNAGQGADDHFALAQRTVTSSLNSAISETSRFSLDELFAPGLGSSRLPDLEAAILGVLRRDAGLADLPAGEGAGTSGSLGVDIVDVGINRIRLTQTNSQDVIARMKADRNGLAADTISRGEATAQSIRSSADRDASRINSFATRLANELRAAGDREAGQYIAQMNESAALATLLDELRFLREAYSKQITLVVSGAPGFRWAQTETLDRMLESQDPSEDSDESESSERDEAVARGDNR
ncbi:MAG: SPFH domain-containing protein [Planctomycetota bacterium]